MTPNDLMRSIIRTVVPAAAAVLISNLPALEPIGDDLGLLLELMVLAVYYTVIRFAETRWAWAGWFLGYKGEPAYLGPKPSAEYEAR